MALTVSKSYFGSNGTVNKPKHDFFIFSINTSLNPENELLFVEAALGFNVKQVRGSYDGKQEMAYLLPIFDNNKEYASKWAAVRKMAKDFDQECVLYVEGESKRASLLYTKGYETSRAIGTFRRMTPSQAIESGNWTLDGNQFYGVIK